MNNDNQNKKYILFSPVGTHDPIGVSKDGVPSEGSMLHIIRHYKPSIVYLYITKELNYNDNRYETAIKEFYPNCEVYNIFSEVEKVNDYDIFMNDFRKYINEIHDKYSKDGYEILLNVASGTPAMKSNLLLEVVNNSIKLIPIQVRTPIERANFNNEKKIEFDINLLDKINKDNEDNNNRCSEIKILTFKKTKMHSQIESLIKRYEYFSALTLLNDDEYSKELFDEKIFKYLEHAYLRLNLKYNDSNIEAFNDYIKKIEDEDIKEFLEYYYVMKVKYKKNELSDFIIRLTPFTTQLLFIFLSRNIEELKNVLIKNKKGIRIVNVKNSNDEDFKILFDDLKDNGTLFNFSHLLKMYDFYQKRYNDSGKYFIDIMQLLMEIRNIEVKYRNNIAHRMVNMSEDKVRTDIENILVKCDEFLKITFGDIKLNYFVYDEINKNILELLQK